MVFALGSSSSISKSMSYGIDEELSEWLGQFYGTPLEADALGLASEFLTAALVVEKEHESARAAYDKARAATDAAWTKYDKDREKARAEYEKVKHGNEKTIEAYENGYQKMHAVREKYAAKRQALFVRLLEHRRSQAKSATVSKSMEGGDVGGGVSGAVSVGAKINMVRKLEKAMKSGKLEKAREEIAAKFGGALVPAVAVVKKSDGDGNGGGGSDPAAGRKLSEVFADVIGFDVDSTLKAMGCGPMAKAATEDDEKKTKTADHDPARRGTDKDAEVTKANGSGTVASGTDRSVGGVSKGGGVATVGAYASGGGAGMSSDGTASGSAGIGHAGMETGGGPGSGAAATQIRGPFEGMPSDASGSEVRLTSEQPRIGGAQPEPGFLALAEGGSNQVAALVAEHYAMAKSFHGVGGVAAEEAAARQAQLASWGELAARGMAEAESERKAALQMLPSFPSAGAAGGAPTLSKAMGGAGGGLETGRPGSLGGGLAGGYGGSFAGGLPLDTANDEFVSKAYMAGLINPMETGMNRPTGMALLGTWKSGCGADVISALCKCPTCGEDRDRRGGAVSKAEGGGNAAEGGLRIDLNGAGLGGGLVADRSIVDSLRPQQMPGVWLGKPSAFVKPFR